MCSDYHVYLCQIQRSIWDTLVKCANMFKVISVGSCQPVLTDVVSVNSSVWVHLNCSFGFLPEGIIFLLRIPMPLPRDPATVNREEVYKVATPIDLSKINQIFKSTSSFRDCKWTRANSKKQEISNL